MPHIKTYNVLTCWSFDEGLPIDIRRLTNSQKSKNFCFGSFSYYF